VLQVFKNDNLSTSVMYDFG